MLRNWASAHRRRITTSDWPVFTFTLDLASLTWIASSLDQDFQGEIEFKIRVSRWDLVCHLQAHARLTSNAFTHPDKANSGEPSWSMILISVAPSVLVVLWCTFVCSCKKFFREVTSKQVKANSNNNKCSLCTTKQTKALAKHSN